VRNFLLFSALGLLLFSKLMAFFFHPGAHNPGNESLEKWWGLKFGECEPWFTTWIEQNWTEKLNVIVVSISGCAHIPLIFRPVNGRRPYSCWSFLKLNAELIYKL
jgi:hypothetical protein